MSRSRSRSVPVRILAAAMSAALAAPLAAQQHAASAAPQVSQSVAPREVEQFAFLIGQWELTITPKVNSLAARIHGAPTYLGTWKAWPAIDRFGVEDELRIMDRSGNPNSLTHTMRFYDGAQSKWILTTLDVYRARHAMASAVQRGSEMTVASYGRDGEGKAYVQRARFHDITPNSFRFTADRSFDSGKTWDTDVLKIEARRVAAAATR
jgi:hypothetical protein